MIADDFGLDEAVNEAVEEGHRHGVLTAASLMVAEGAAADAVRRARRLPGLGVGLHLSLTHGQSVLPPRDIPHLVDAAGRFDERLVRAALNWCRPRVLEELGREVEAQFRAFLATGLPLDHVSVHQHMHLHPALLGALLASGARCGLPYVRVPLEPRPMALGERGQGAVTTLLARRMARRLDARGIRHADRLAGLAVSGRLGERNLLAILSVLPDGLTEIYGHPAARPTTLLRREQAGYRGEAELAALLSPRVRQAIAEQGCTLQRCGVART